MDNSSSIPNEELERIVKRTIAFLHIDCDLYSSTKTIFNELKDYFQKGTIIVFDEYFNYHNWQNHEYKAFQEFIQENKFEYNYIAFSGAKSVCIKIISVGGI